MSSLSLLIFCLLALSITLTELLKSLQLFVYSSFHSVSFCFIYFVAVFSCYPFTIVKYMTCPLGLKQSFLKYIQSSCHIVSFCIITLFHPLLFALESLNLNCVTKISIPRQRKRISYPVFSSTV